MLSLNSAVQITIQGTGELESHLKAHDIIHVFFREGKATKKKRAERVDPRRFGKGLTCVWQRRCPPVGV